jgi:hypothetical protein
MKAIIAIFRFDINRIFKIWQYYIIMLIFFGLSLYFIQDGVDSYKSTHRNLPNFTSIERDKVEKYQYYTQYAGFGFRVEFLPAPLGIFFYNSGIFMELTANVNAGEKMNLYNNFKGKDIFIERPGRYADFSGLMIYLGSLMTLFYGFASIPGKDYLRFQVGLLGKKRFFWSLVSGKFLVLALYFSLVTSVGVFLGLLNGIIFTLRDYLLLAAYLGIFLAVILVFLFIGLTAGSLRSKANGLILIILVWFGLFYLYPTAVQKIITKKAQSIPTNYKIEMSIMDILTKLEKKAEELVGKNTLGKKIIPGITELMKAFLENEFKKIMDIEGEIEKKTEKNIKLSQYLKVLNPPGLYFSISSELSSKGYDEVLLFSRYNRKLKYDFENFYIEMNYILKKSKVESFIKNQENIYYGKSRFPGISWLGLLLLGIYLAGLSLVAYNRFVAGLFYIPKQELEECRLQQFEAAFREGSYRVWTALTDTYRGMLFALFSGQGFRLVKEGFNGNVTWNGKELCTSWLNLPFLYIFKPESLPVDPGLRVKDWVRFAAGLMAVPGSVIKNLLESTFFKSLADKKLKDLSQVEKIEILMAITGLRRFPLYLFNDTVYLQPLDTMTRFVELMEKLKAEGAAVLYVTTDDSLRKEDTPKDKSVMEAEYWAGNILVRTGRIKGLIELETVSSVKASKKSKKPGNKRYKVKEDKHET